MRRSHLFTAALALAVGFAAGHRAGAPGRPDRGPAPARPLPVTEVIVSWPDPAARGGSAAKRFRVSHSGSNTSVDRAPLPDEWGVVLFHDGPAGDGPRRYTSHFGVPDR